MKKFITYFEIPAADFNRAVKFYETVFGVSLEICSYKGNRQMAFFPGENGKFQGAVSSNPVCIPVNNGVFISFQVDNMEQTLDQIKKMGGTILHSKEKIEEKGFGYSSLFIDSEGNRIGLNSER